MTDNKDKKPSPVTTAILDGVCETLGIYRRESAKEVKYDYEWLESPLAKSRYSLTHTAQDPLLKVLAALLQPEPPPDKPKPDGAVAPPKLPCFFRVHKDVPLGLAVRTVDTALGVDVVAMLPKNASLAPNPAALKPPRPPPTLLARARLARLITGGNVAELEKPVTLGLELHLAHKPAVGEPELRPFTALALEVGVDDKAPVSLVVTDATALTVTNGEAAARRTVTWNRGDSLVRPLVHAGLVLLRAMLVWLAEKNSKDKDHAAVRVRNHLFPLVEGFPGLKPFPLAAFQGDFAALRDWLKSFLQPTVVMTVLEHLRALVSGEQDGKTAPGSAIAWMTARPAGTDYTAPNPRDFGLIVRTTGDEFRGSAALGLRGQASWKFGDAVRIGLALEGELVRASWDLQLENNGQPKASAKARASTGSANVFLVIEGVAGVSLCDTAHNNLASVGALARLELGASLSTAGLLPELRATFRTTGTDGKPQDVTRSLGALLHELREAAEAQAQAVLAAAGAQAQAAIDAAWDAIKPLLDELMAVVVQLQQAVVALVAKLAEVLPTPVHDALVELLADIRTKIDDRLESKNISGLPAGLVDLAKLRGLVAATITWTRTEAPKILPAVPTVADTLDLDLGLATLQLAANLDPNNPDAASFGATLTPKLEKFTDGLPVRLSPGTSIGVSLTPSSEPGLTFVAGLELAPIADLPLTPGIKFSLDTNTNAPRIDVELRPNNNSQPPANAAANALASLRVLGGTPVAALEQVRDLAQKLVRPLINTGRLKNVSLAPDLPALKLLEIAGFTANGFAPPDPAVAAQNLLDPDRPGRRRARPGRGRGRPGRGLGRRPHLHPRHPHDRRQQPLARRRRLLRRHRFGPRPAAQRRQARPERRAQRHHPLAHRPGRPRLRRRLRVRRHPDRQGLGRRRRAEAAQGRPRAPRRPPPARARRRRQGRQGRGRPALDRQGQPGHPPRPRLGGPIWLLRQVPVRRPEARAADRPRDRPARRQAPDRHAAAAADDAGAEADADDAQARPRRHL
jgi:hypothetical protein